MNEDLYALWAPPESDWSVWAKPVLFTDAPPPPQTDDPMTVPDAGKFPPPRNTAAIVDLDGALSVRVGLALAKIGYRPVPLYNSGVEAAMLVNMFPIAQALSYGASALKQCHISALAPPAFLLNSDRLDHPDAAKRPGVYDNRWRLVPQDMPSAEYLCDAGIEKIVVIALEMMDDLRYVLFQYQEAGISILRTDDLATAPKVETVTRPPFFKVFLYRLQAYSGLRRNAAGGFGAVVPDPESSGGFFG